MKRLKGPDLKMPELKTPDFLTDLYYDLRDRRLLPLVALVVVAIGAVPFLLGSGEEAFVPQPAEPLSALGSAEKTSKLTVVEATPGLRDYRKRLSHRSPANPFKQRYTGLPPSAKVTSGSTTSEGESGSSTVGSSEGGTTEVPPPGDTPEGGSGGAGGDGSAQKYEFVIDVQIAHSEKTPDGGEKMGPLEARHDVPVLAQLPGKKTGVVTVLGANFQTERLVFLVSHAVKSIGGEYSCVSRGEICELLEVGEGILLEYVYEPTGVRYAIKVTNAAVIPTRKKRAQRSARAAFVLSHPGMSLPAVVGQFQK